MTDGTTEYVEDPGPPVGRRGWAGEHAPSPANGFAASPDTAQLVEHLRQVVLEHCGDGLGRCARCGEEWVCPAYLHAMAELRRRGVPRPILEGP